MYSHASSLKDDKQHEKPEDGVSGSTADRSHEVMDDVQEKGRLLELANLSSPTQRQSAKGKRRHGSAGDSWWWGDGDSSAFQSAVVKATAPVPL